ncbi:hypothetical protein D3C83_12510 [compost metagenome]
MGAPGTMEPANTPFTSGLRILSATAFTSSFRSCFLRYLARSTFASKSATGKLTLAFRSARPGICTSTICAPAAFSLSSAASASFWVSASMLRKK